MVAKQRWQRPAVAAAAAVAPHTHTHLLINYAKDLFKVSVLIVIDCVICGTRTVQDGTGAVKPISTNDIIVVAQGFTNINDGKYWLALYSMCLRQHIRYQLECRLGLKDGVVGQAAAAARPQ